MRKVKGIGEKTIERIKGVLLQEQDNEYVSRYDKNIKLDINNIYHGDCLELMNGIEDKSIDMILCDLPYGTTACSWDTIIPFEPLWKQYERIIKDNGAIVLFGSQPFTSQLISSNLKLFKYEIIWEKDSVTSPFLAKRQIMKRHENILVFYKEQCTFHPQMIKRKEKNKRKNNRKNYPTASKGSAVIKGDNIGNEEYTYPSSVQKFNRCKERGLHPTQKPIGLCEWLIKTYTNEGDLVLDNCIGSGTTAISAINTNRNFIGIELQDEYYKLAKDRIDKHIIDNNLQDRYSILA